ncbi:hypothetical protein tloyanaT_25960 [Thalassotalea loyana]|uniref:Protease HtpX n=1 Tax=Thalassotalea loyana TaxID=280483 RepID=A0ABQ6HE36_9GAMM|nr:hypothetical protein tloyanaT_25960 [Thalassotalea loyana]
MKTLKACLIWLANIALALLAVLILGGAISLEQYVIGAWS